MRDDRVGATFTRAGSRGFSFLELLVVMVVSSILLGITLWRVGPSFERGRVRKAAGAIVADLMFAQAEAARGRSTVVVVLVPGQSTLFVRDRDDASRIYRRRDLGDGGEFEMDSVTATPTNMVEILANGLARQNVTFTATRGESRRNVILTRAGQIRVVVP